jgi:hypothetical protein
MFEPVSDSTLIVASGLSSGEQLACSKGLHNHVLLVTSFTPRLLGDIQSEIR